MSTFPTIEARSFKDFEQAFEITRRDRDDWKRQAEVWRDHIGELNGLIMKLERKVEKLKRKAA